uniref:GM10877p n=1 Tax=Drosophila melanogaster TaxID=7227 RepID=Q8MSZ3_DROME|nr:GM10877p [Drosophila melanogaster]
MTHSSTTFEPENLSCAAKGVEGQATLGIQPNDNGQAIQCPNAGVAKSKSLSRCPTNSRPDQVVRMRTWQQMCSTQVLKLLH